MEKYEVPYEEFKAVCLELVESFKMFKPDVIVCVARGGMTAAHIVAKAMNLPVAFVANYDGYMTSMGLYPRTQKTAIVIDDMADQGRTLDKVRDYLTEDFEGIKFYYSAVYRVGTYTNIDLIGRVVVDKWLVMPNEESCKVTVGDKNLFSEGNSQYGTN